MKPLLSILICIFLFVNSMAQNNTEFVLLEKPDDSSCFQYQVIKDGKKYMLNREASKSLECPSAVGLYKNWIFYSNLHNQVIQYNLRTHETTTIFTLYPDVDGVDGPFWSPDHSKLAFTITNLNMNHGYDSYVRVILYDFAQDGSLSNKRKFDIDAYFECGGNCWSTIDILDNETIRYRDLMDKRGDNDAENYKYLKLN